MKTATQKTDTEKAAKASAYFTLELAAERQDFTNWKERLDADPLYALEWGDAAFATAARIKVLRRAVGLLARVGQDDMTFDTVVESHQGKLLELGKFPVQSSSATANLLAQHELSATARLLGDLMICRGGVA